MAHVSVKQEKILYSVLMLFDATDVDKLLKRFPMGSTFTKKTRTAKSMISHLQDGIKYVIRALPCYMPIPCRLAIMVKGKLDNIHHDDDHIQGLNPFDNGCLEAMIGKGLGRIAFDPELQKAIPADLSTL